MAWLIDRELWMRIYGEIISKLKLNFDLDQLATEILSSILSSMDNAIDVERLRSVLNESEGILIFAPGPNLEQDFERALKLKLLKELPTIFIDGAITFALERGFTPTLIVTDLDGVPQHILKLNKRGSIAIVHGHGDNIEEVKSWVPRFKGPVVGSTQVEPRPYVYNFGGFTDGDRALFIAYALGVRRAIVGGMAFHGPVGRYSLLYKRKSEDVKRVKMAVAVKLIELLMSWGMEIESLSYAGIPNIRVI
ncbi:MAG: DUF115 domain-containing protein [Desulfurococcaceae archaeon]|nr:DUF115 domain-containing protein [Sulfolobales archaeon]MDW8170148.1 DUF115 domain-containing protein [Desulfurococcaceae archaeon]